MSALSPNGIARWIYDNADIAIYEENGESHISSSYFLDVPIREPLLNSLSSFIDSMRIASLVGISQGVDYGIQSITTWLGIRLQKPIFAHAEGELKSPDIEIRSNLSNCSLLTAYTSNEQQVLDIVSGIERCGGNPVQVITLIDENSFCFAYSPSFALDFQKVISLSEIVNSLRTLPNVEKKKVVAIEKKLQL